MLLRISSAALSFRSDGPNVEYKSLRNLELTPYVMRDGTWYRDMLTIEASRAVGHFAQKPHKFPQNNYFGYNERRHYSEIPPQFLEDRTYHKSSLHNVFKPA